MVSKSTKTFDNIKEKVKKVVLPLVTPVIVVSSAGEAKGSTANILKDDENRDNVRVYSPLPNNSQKNDVHTSDVFYDRMIKCNINEMVCNRADWLCQEYVNAASRRLDEIRSCGNKNVYVKKMFARMGHGYKYDEYCLVAQLSAFKDVTDRTGNLQNVLPSSAGCANFLKNLRNKGFGDCIRENPAFSSIRPGDMIFTPRGKGKYHAVSVKKVWKDEKGKYHVLLTSFNNDHYYELTAAKSYTVVNMHKLTEKSLWKELETKRFLPAGFEKGNVVQIIPLDNYKQIKAFLTVGMERSNENLASNENAANNEGKSDKEDSSAERRPIATIQMFRAAKNNGYS